MEIKCDAKECNNKTVDYDVHRTINGGYIHGVNLCAKHRKYLSGW